MTKTAELTEKETTRTTSGSIYIRPFVNPTVENMGLEKEGLALHDGTTHKEWLTCLEKHGIKRHLTGLDELAPEIERLTDPVKKKAVIKQIRERVIYLEKTLAGNDDLKIGDEDFWKKVKIIRRDNYDYWNKIFIEVGNEPYKLDPLDPADLIKISAIEAHGFSEIAKSYDDARGGSVTYKFYLDKEDTTAELKTAPKKIKNKALAMLSALSDSEQKKLWYVAKSVDLNSVQYKKNTSPDIVYNNMDIFINGNSTERSVEKAATLFIKTAEMDLEELRIKAVVRDATFYKYLIHKVDGNIYHNKSNTLIGKNVADCCEYFKNALHADVWKLLYSEVEPNWN